jgi:hypothetical protein
LIFLFFLALREREGAGESRVDWEVEALGVEEEEWEGRRRFLVAEEGVVLMGVGAIVALLSSYKLNKERELKLRVER